MARQKPGPHPEYPKDQLVRMRVDIITLKKIDWCAEKLGMNRSELLRYGVEKIYDELFKK